MDIRVTRVILYWYLSNEGKRLKGRGVRVHSHVIFLNDDLLHRGGVCHNNGKLIADKREENIHLLRVYGLRVTGYRLSYGCGVEGRECRVSF